MFRAPAKRMILCAVAGAALCALTTPASATMPPAADGAAEQRMASIVDEFATRYDQAQNGMAQGAVRVARKNALCRIPDGPLVPFKGAVRDWIGVVEVLDSTNDGRGVLRVRITPHFSVSTTNNRISESLGPPTLIAARSNLYRTAVTLSVGQTVRFSGTMFPSHDDCAQELSLTVSGSMHDPEFLFRFTELAPVDPASDQLH